MTADDNRNQNGAGRRREAASEQELSEQLKYWNKYINPGYEPYYEVVDAAIMRKPSIGFALGALNATYGQRGWT